NMAVSASSWPTRKMWKTRSSPSWVWRSTSTPPLSTYRYSTASSPSRNSVSPSSAWSTAASRNSRRATSAGASLKRGCPSTRAGESWVGLTFVIGIRRSGMRLYAIDNNSHSVMREPLRPSYRLARLCLLAILLAPGLSAQAAPRDRLVLAGPTAAVSFPLIHMVETGALSGWADKVEFRHWKNPDQLRVLLAKQEADFSATPVNLPAIMANRGMPVRLLNVSVWGLLWFVSTDPDVRSIADLAGKPLLTTFQRDLPALLLERLLDAQGLAGERAPRIRHARDAQDAIALLLTGEATSALLPEPSVSLLLAQNARRGGTAPHRVQSLEAAWRETFPEHPDLP